MASLAVGFTMVTATQWIQLSAPKRAIDYPKNSLGTAAPEDMSYLAGRYYGNQRPALDKTFDIFSSPIACSALSSTVKSSQQEASFWSVTNWFLPVLQLKYVASQW